MYTQCPYCKTTFRIAEAHLKAAKGMVRCGSCQEVFDATKHLTSGVPGESKPARPATPPPAVTQKPPVRTPPPIPAKPVAAQTNKPVIKEPPFTFSDEEEHEHIDLSTPVRRENVPDQTPFMDSIYDEHSPYNNLDEMGTIHIPGELNFGDSIIKFVDDKEDNPQRQEPPGKKPETSIDFDAADLEIEIDDENQAQAAVNIYEDTESIEPPASTTERAAIDDLYQFADDQLSEDEQLEKNIEELLNYTSGLDNEPAVNWQNRAIGLDDLDDFEKELDNLDLHGPMETKQPSKTTTLDTQYKLDIQKSKLDEFEDFDTDIDFDIDDKEEVPAEKNIDISVTPEIASAPVPEAEPASETTSLSATAKSQPSEDELPSAEFEIPKALRSSFQHAEIPRHIGLTLALGAASVALTFAFLFQLVLFRSYELANSFPALSPIFSTLCDTIPCRYSGPIDVSKIELLNRDVRSHPSQKNAVLISAAFINNAKFDQPYPTIAVKLSDLSGNIVATRHFKPEEYLEQLYTQFLLMEAGTPIHITLAVLDPGDDAMNFEFSFLQ